MATRTRPFRADADADRLAYILAAQQHCDAYLPTIADPAGKRVVVVGCGAGTEMLWAMRHGAREVVGLDVVPQSPAALEQAVAAAGLPATTSDGAPRFHILELAAEDAAALGERFDLVLSNNVFEHLSDLQGALHACAALAEPGHGRVAVFTDPLFWSSTGSHLPHRPWEHLTVDLGPEAGTPPWAAGATRAETISTTTVAHDPAADASAANAARATVTAGPAAPRSLTGSDSGANGDASGRADRLLDGRAGAGADGGGDGRSGNAADAAALHARLLPLLPNWHALHDLPLPDYLFAEITLNRMRLADFAAAVRDAGLVFLHLGLVVDRHLAELPDHLAAIRAQHPTAAPGDLALEGIAAELVRLPPGPLAAGHATPGAVSPGQVPPGQLPPDQVPSEPAISSHPAPSVPASPPTVAGPARAVAADAAGSTDTLYEPTAQRRRRQLQEEIDRLYGEEAALRSAAAEQEAEVSRLHGSVASLFAEVTRLNDVFAAQHADVGRLHAEVTALSEQNQILHAARGRLAAAEEELAATRIACSGLQEEVARLLAENGRLYGEEARLDGVARGLVAEVARGEGERAELRATLATREAELAVARAEALALASSRSYRLGRALTAPLRWLRGS